MSWAFRDLIQGEPGPWAGFRNIAMSKQSFRQSGRVTAVGVQSTLPRSEQFAARMVMSEGRAAFWRDLVHALDGTDCAAKTAALLLRRHRRFEGKVYGSQVNMAEQLCVHPNTVSAHTRRLEKAGLLTITRVAPERDSSTGEWSRRETNRYWLRFPCKEQAANRRVKRRRARLGIETVIDPVSLSPAAEELLASPIATDVMAVIDGPEPISAVRTYTQSDGSDALTGTKDTGPHEVGEPRVVEKQIVSTEFDQPLSLMDAKAAIAAARASLNTGLSPRRRP
jgi:DNA-binding transcriptional ArsR family regulator